MQCRICRTVMTRAEIAEGKEKCVTCLVKGYKFAMSKMFREIEALEEQLGRQKLTDNKAIKIVNHNEGVPVGLGEPKPKKKIILRKKNR